MNEFEKGKKAINLIKEMPNLSIVDFTTDLAEKSAKIKTRFKVSLVDAIIVVSAISLSANCLVTRDSDFNVMNNFISIKRPEDII